MTYPYDNNRLTRRHPSFDALDPLVDTLVLSEHPVQIMSAPKLPGPHYVGPFDEHTVNTIYWPNIRKCQYPWVTIVGAGQYKEARAFAAGVQNDPVRTNVVFRHWVGVQGSPNDNGRLNDLSAPEWIERVGVQHVGAKYWVMPDNEGLGALVVKNTVDLIPRASSLKLKLAVGAWSSHVEPERKDIRGRPEWPTYLPLYAMLYKHPEHIAAPHIYYSRPPKSVENMDGFKYLLELFAYVERMMTAPLPFEVVITEVGRLTNRDGKWLDPNGGYQLEGVGEQDYADELVTITAQYPQWSFNPFSRGAWGTRGSLGVGQVYEARMEQYASGELAMPDGPLEPEPEGPPQYLERELNAGANMRIREPFPDGKPNPDGKVLITVPDGELIDVDVHSVTKPVGQNLEWVRVQWLDQRDADALALYKGWMGILAGKTLDTQFKDVLTGEQPIPEEPPPPPDDLPNNAPATIHDVDKLRVEMLEYNKLKFEELHSELGKLKAENVTLSARVDRYERILRAHHLNIENELKLVG